MSSRRHREGDRGPKLAESANQQRAASKMLPAGYQDYHRILETHLGRIVMDNTM
ncbi:MAG TPA: hypothetical protein VFY27_03475 [Woeseiaceae bacterium]|nr:hypothetical protein [Woeseiaceae bacterium]